MLNPTLSVREAAGYLKVQPRTVRGWIACGKLSACKIGKSYIIPIEEISRLVSNIGQTDPIKLPDPNRKSRIAMMKGSLIRTGITLEILDRQRQRELDSRKTAGEFRL